MATPFVPFYTGSLLETERPGERDVLDVPTTWGEGFGAQFTDAWQGSPGPMLYRWFRRQGAEYDQSPLLQPEEANRRFAFAGQPALFDEPITEMRARDIWEINRERLRRENVIARSSLGGFGSFVAGLGGGALDPLNIAAGIVPGVVAARLGVAAAEIGYRGSIAARAAWGAAEGAIGTAAIAPIQYALSQSERRPFTVADAFTSVVFGTVLGAGLHAGVAAFQHWRRTGTSMPAIEQALQNTSADTRNVLLRGAVANVMEGRPVDVAPLVDNVFQTQLRPKLSLARAIDVAEGRVAREEGDALRTTVRDVARAERGESTASLNARIAEIEQSAATLRREAAVVRGKANKPIEELGRRVGFRVSQIDEVLALETISDAQRKVLTAERADLIRGSTADAEANLNKLRSAAEARGLNTAAERLEAKGERAKATLARRAESVAQASAAFNRATRKAVDRRSVIQALTERTLRRAIGDKIQAGVQNIPAEEFTKSALRIMTAERTAAPATIQAELERLGRLGGMAVKGSAATAPAANGGTAAAVAGLPGEGGTPGTAQATGASAQRQGVITNIARRNANPYTDPEGLDASRLADEAVAAARSTPIKARAPDQGIGAESEAIRELDELSAVDEAIVQDMDRLGVLDAADKDYLSVADEQIAKAELHGKARDLASICLVTGA